MHRVVWAREKGESASGNVRVVDELTGRREAADDDQARQARSQAKTARTELDKEDPLGRDRSDE